MAKGGKRIGAGRPIGHHTKHRKTIEQEAQRELFNKMVDDRWGDIIKAHIKSSLIPGKEGNEPRKYIIDQRVGRPMEHIKVDAEIDITMDF